MPSQSHQTCPACGTATAAAAKFCASCGSPITPVTAGTPAAPAAATSSTSASPSSSTAPSNRTVWPGEPALKQALPASAETGHRSSIYDRPAWMASEPGSGIAAPGARTTSGAPGADAFTATPATISGPQPPLTSTIVSSFLLGPFGAIWANRAANEARERGHVTGRYWWAFALSWVGGSFTVFLASILLPIALLGIAVRGSGTASSANAPVGVQQPYSVQGQGQGAGDNSGTSAGTDSGTGAGVAAGSDTTPSTDSSDQLTLTGSPLALPSDASTCPDAPTSGRAAVGANTTCGFAMNVLEAWQQAGAPASETFVTASSRATGQTYSMDCTATTAAASSSGYALVTCTGGVNAKVYIY